MDNLNRQSHSAETQSSEQTKPFNVSGSSIFCYGWEIEPELGFDLTAAQRGLMAWEGNVLIAPINASLNLTGDRLNIEPSQLGIGLDLDGAEALYEWADDGVVVEILEQGEKSSWPGSHARASLQHQRFGRDEPNQLAR